MKWKDRVEKSAVLSNVAPAEAHSLFGHPDFASTVERVSNQLYGVLLQESLRNPDATAIILARVLPQTAFSPFQTQFRTPNFLARLLTQLPLSLGSSWRDFRRRLQFHYIACPLTL